MMELQRQPPVKEKNTTAGGKRSMMSVMVGVSSSRSGKGGSLRKRGVALSGAKLKRSGG